MLQSKLGQRLTPLHPFPARMAPEIALEAMNCIEPSSTVVDPMCGSGVVLRQAVQLGHKAIGFDLDPLSVLMSKVWTNPLNTTHLLRDGQTIIDEAKSIQSTEVSLPWIDEDYETTKFIEFWFADRQRDELRRLAYVLDRKCEPVNQALRLAISKLIVTKKVGASLAWDVSHSRPHRVKLDNNYDVFDGFKKAVSSMANEILKIPDGSSAMVRIGDAKKLSLVRNGSADIVVTSPPYLNAIDYLRGHRLALVWLGYRLSTLRHIRSATVGNEKKLSECQSNSMKLYYDIARDDYDPAMEPRMKKYAFDMTQVLVEIRRILRPNGRAVLVVGSSNIRGHSIDSPSLIRSVALLLGFRELSCTEREIPSNKRYLPPPTSTAQESLRRRMRTESILTLQRIGA